MTTLNEALALERTVRVADLRAYLLSSGWKIKPFKRPEVIYFEGPLDDEGSPLVLLLPASEHLRDYPLRIEEILRTLSILERRPVTEIIRNIVRPTSDVLHVCLESPETPTGTLELGAVERFTSKSLRGRVVRLSGKDPHYGEAGSLAILLEVEKEGAPPSVEIVLNREQYQRAGVAHLQGQRISVSGILDRIGRSWHLLDVTDFQVLSETNS